MGFNPHRTHRHSAWDYLMVGSALAVIAAVVLWALLG
jgi:hypothetical protein